MKIRDFRFQEFDLPLASGYRIAGHSIDAVTNFIVRIETDSGLVGYGCAAPAEEVTGEDPGRCRDALDGAIRDFLSNANVAADPSSLALAMLEAVAGAPAACAAADMALWDVAAKAARKPLFEFLGGTARPLPTSVTIGVCGVDETRREASQWLERGFTILKVKIGEDVETDIRLLAALRRHVGADVTIRVDANRGYDLRSARRFLAATTELALELLEQPLASADLEGAAALTQESDIPIIADESVVSIADATRIIDRQAAHGINIKLMKCGGISAARVIGDKAAAAGISLMLGCNDETRISISAALHLAHAMPQVRYIDLDGHMDLVRDPSNGGFKTRDGVLRPGHRPGLGIDVGL